MSDSIECVGQIQFEDESFLVPGKTRVNSFLYKQNRVSYLPVGQEPSLIFRYQRGEERFESRSQEFRQDFIRGVAERYGPKPGEGRRSVFFRMRAKNVALV